MTLSSLRVLPKKGASRVWKYPFAALACLFFFAYDFGQKTLGLGLACALVAWACAQDDDTQE